MNNDFMSIKTPHVLVFVNYIQIKCINNSSYIPSAFGIYTNLNYHFLENLFYYIIECYFVSLSLLIKVTSYFTTGYRFFFILKNPSIQGILICFLT